MAEQTTPLQIRLAPALLAELDAFRARFPFEPSRPEVAHRALVEWLASQAHPSSVTEDAPGFDAAKYFLGSLCHNGHDWQQTGQSLRDKASRHCVACDRERKKKPTTP